MEAILQNEKAQRDYQLVLAAREKGDQRAYADLMRFYREPIYMMLLRMTHNPTEADDLTIETFGKAFFIFCPVILTTVGTKCCTKCLIRLMN